MISPSEVEGWSMAAWTCWKSHPVEQTVMVGFFGRDVGKGVFVGEEVFVGGIDVSVGRVVISGELVGESSG
jgi:hypothetical protein